MLVGQFLEKPPQTAEVRSFIWEQLKEYPDYQALQKDPCYFSSSALGLRSPLNLPDMDLAVQYLQTAITQKQSICVVGDRDVDGVSSTALLVSFLQKNHQGKLTYIVSEDKDDYGLSGNVLQKTIASQAALVILLDMGSSNGPEIELLIEKIDCRAIVLDHHILHDRIPDTDCCALVNPQRNTSQHPGHAGKIATGGLVFKLLFAFALSHTREWQRIYLLDTKEGLAAFRCGHYLATFSSIEAYSSWEKTTYPDKQDKQSAWECIHLQGLESDPYHFSPEEKAKAWQAPDYGGKLLLAKTIANRPRLRDLHTFLS